MHLYFNPDWYLYWPPPFHDDIIALFLDLDLDLRVLVCHFEYPEFLCIDQPLQGNHVGPVHAFEIIAFIDNFPHILPPAYRYGGQSTRALINLMRFCILTVPNRSDNDYLPFSAIFDQSIK